MLVIHNADIHTLDPEHPAASAIAINQGRVLAIGNDDGLLDSFPTAKKLNAEQRTIIPGITDAHIHLEDYALSLQKVECETATQQECLQNVADRAYTTPKGEWILGHGWNQNNWVEGYGSAGLLDEITTDHPVYLTHKSLHCGWANSAALQLAGITANSPDPTGGRIGRLPNGDPDGILYESAMELLVAAIPPPSLDQVVKVLGAAIPRLWRKGLTGTHDFDGPRCFSALEVLNQQGRLNLRVLKGIHLEDLPHAVELGLCSGFGDDMLRIGALKLFADGALGPHTAAMLAPYYGEAENLGMLSMDADKVFEHGRMAIEHGISLAVHAIGDRANREVLTGYAKLREYEQSLHLPPQRLRHRIEHVQVIHPDDIPRLSELKIIASMQPIHATSDMLMAEHSWGERSAYAYAWRSLLKNKTKLIFGSDAPVESANPLWGIHAAVTRRRADDYPSAEGWYPEQRLSVDEALQAYTTGPAFAANMEDRLGKLKAGYKADLLVLDVNLFTCPPEELPAIHPLATMVDGKWVFSELE